MAQRRVELILDPPTAELGVPYTGKVVNITKFGAFVNILPGRDGLLHISKIGGGKRIDRVEDVLNLGDEVEVRVDDIDQSGKLSLSLVGADNGDGDNGDGGGGSSRERSDRPRRSRDSDAERAPAERVSRSAASDADGASGAKAASFEDSWDEQVREEFGDLGPAEATRSGGGGGGGGGGRRGGGGGGRRRR